MSKSFKLAKGFGRTVLPMSLIYQIYYLVALGLAIISGFLILAYHLLSGREEQ
ncbi:MAG: hypothetical protein ACFFDJ_00610 [Candidatus Odinarchaeota archaeon]